MLVATVRAGCPGMEIVEGQAQLWHEVLGDLRIEDCRKAVVRLVRQSSRFIAPATIRDEVMHLRSERLERVKFPEPPSNLPDDPDAYRQWLIRTTKQIADTGRVPEPRDELKPRDMTQIENTWPKPPTEDVA